MVGIRIKEYLIKNGIKQTFIVERTGLTPTIVSDICKGKRNIECREYYKICKALQVPLETFIEEN